MPVFEYTGLTEAGKNVRGLRDAESSKVLRQILRKDGVYLTDARAAEAGAVAGEQKAGLSREVDVGALFGFTGVSSQDLAIATRQLATLIAAGIPLVEALTALVDQVEQPRLKRIMGAVKQKVNEGSSLADALAEHPKVFTDLYVNMIRAGESSGALDVVLVRLADFTEAQALLRNKIIGAMLYPAIMVVVGIAIVGILFVVVIPKVTKIFEDMQVTLPWTTRLLIALSSFARDYWYVLLIALPGLAYGVRRWVRTSKGRGWWDRTQLRAPVFGHLLRMLAISRFAKTLATLLASGVPLLTAMDIVKNIVGNTLLSDTIEKARDAIREGESIAAPLKRSGQFPPLVYHMIAIGEKSGQLEEMLQNVAKSYEAQVEMRVSALTSLLEPVMIVAMGGGVAFIVFSILMPIMQLNTFVPK
ncbi:MAG TPA: type II secretion system inner membrane protein GspF [Myxococcales bacterium]|jgi:general secretion pathway protein F|nr:type II secretion system inner membrane protein GspF [Myxococcales bacterium]